MKASHQGNLKNFIRGHKDLHINIRPGSKVPTTMIRAGCETAS